MEEVKPDFQISTRVGAHDRSLAIFKLVQDSKQLRVLGPEFPCFRYTPTVMALVINNYCLLNVSHYDLCLRRLGFPYPSKAVFYNRFRAEIYLSRGSETVQPPVVPSLQTPAGTLLHQPMFTTYRSSPAHKGLFQNDYVKENSLNYEQGKGQIFIEAGGTVRRFESGSGWVPRSTHRAADLLPSVLRIVSSRQLRDHEHAARIAVPSEKKQLWTSVHRMRFLNSAIESLLLKHRMPTDYHSPSIQRLFNRKDD